MNTSQYQSEIRKGMKRQQRTPAYIKLQKESAVNRANLEKKLAERNNTIIELRKALKAFKDSNFTIPSVDFDKLGV